MTERRTARTPTPADLAAVLAALRVENEARVDALKARQARYDPCDLLRWHLPPAPPEPEHDDQEED